MYSVLFCSERQLYLCLGDLSCTCCFLRHLLRKKPEIHSFHIPCTVFLAVFMQVCYSFLSHFFYLFFLSFMCNVSSECWRSLLCTNFTLLLLQVSLTIDDAFITSFFCFNSHKDLLRFLDIYSAKLIRDLLNSYLLRFENDKIEILHTSLVTTDYYNV